MYESTITSIGTLPPAGPDYANRLYRQAIPGSTDKFYLAEKDNTGVWSWQELAFISDLGSGGLTGVTDTTSIDLTVVGSNISAAAIFGTTAGTVAQGNHTHVNDHVAVTILDTASINLTLTGQQISADAIFGTTAGTVAQGNHSHANDHVAATVVDTTSIDLTLTGQQISAAAIFGTTAGTVAQGNHSHANDHVAATVLDTASINLTLTGQQISADAIFGTTATTIAAGNHTHSQLHDPVTVTDTASIDLTLTGQQVSAAAIFGNTATTIAAGNHTHAYLTDPMTTRGDIIYRNASNVTARLGVGANGFVLSSDGTDVSWGGYVLPPVASGRLEGAFRYSPVGATAGVTVIAGTTYWVPFFVGPQNSFDAIIFEVTATVAGNITVAIYDSDLQFNPANRLVVSAVTAVSTIGVKTFSISSTSLGPNKWYHIGFVATTAQTIRGAVAATQVAIHGMIDSNLTNPSIMRAQSGASVPTSPVPTSYSVAGVLIIGARRV